jgi:hypothetical protein
MRNFTQINSKPTKPKPNNPPKPQSKDNLMTHTFQPLTPDTSISFAGKTGDVILRIDDSGKLFWREREIETDDDLRAGLKELVENFRKGFKNGY